jgi:hypothetical protein
LIAKEVDVLLTPASIMTTQLCFAKVTVSHEIEGRLVLNFIFEVDGVLKLECKLHKIKHSVITYKPRRYEYLTSALILLPFDHRK